MYHSKDIEQLHIEISTHCQLECPMCGRNDRGGLENSKLIKKNMSLETFKKLFPVEFLQQIKVINLCGNYGDPIMNRELKEITEYITINAIYGELHIHTNGGAKTALWWSKYIEALAPKHTIHFALDGLADTHSLYRVKSDYHKVLENASAFINAGGNARWVFLKFKHNQHQVEEARLLAKELGFSSFQVKESARFIATDNFPVLDNNGCVTHTLEQPTEHKLTFIDRKTVENYKEILSTVTIDCAVKKTKDLYIDVHGHVFPCCYVGAIPYSYTRLDAPGYPYSVQNLKQFNDLDLGSFNGKITPIDELIDSDKWQNTYNNILKDKTLLTCSKVCGKKVSSTSDQFTVLDSFIQ